jgi:hypothetical protein
MRRDLTGCFTGKQVALRFPSLASRLVEARWRVVHVAQSWSLHRYQVEDGRIDTTCYVGPYYPYFTIFYVLDSRGIVVF